MSIVPYKAKKIKNSDKPDIIKLNQTVVDDRQILSEDMNSLEQQIKDLQIKLDSTKHIRHFKEYLSMMCLKNLKTITIIQCSQSIKNNQCKSCNSRITLLRKLQAKDI